jgi:hypothetical protein
VSEAAGSASMCVGRFHGQRKKAARRRMRVFVREIIVVQKARDPLARHEARIFSTTRARHGTSYSGPGLSPAR